MSSPQSQQQLPMHAASYPPGQDYQHPPQGQLGQPSNTQQPMSNAQLGDQYRSALFAQCAQGNHQPETKYGVCGIITAVVCFPCGLICLFSDTEKKCSRCGITLG
ncbi:hypothetical protein K435DRAFT_761920 [Dendrothele bispora CBS 962.96]|uniref:Uncharacterized protein n=1 Tax=Dendrothele bispora (strain CBS 962.96) TaxID=1314807 RepID=A0A4S8LH70_DENBC|nr:hypothetical protein K435DRAFT_761920 [Dendrothele bispora CBS 962.96]